MFMLNSEIPTYGDRCDELNKEYINEYESPCLCVLTGAFTLSYSRLKSSCVLPFVIIQAKFVTILLIPYQYT